MIDRSMTGGGEGPSVAEVATSFPARLLGAIEEQRRFLDSQVKKKEEEKSQVLWKFQREVMTFSLSPIRFL